MRDGGWPEPPQFPAGPFAAGEAHDDRRHAAWIDEIERAPMRLREAVSGLSDEQLDIKYRNWTIRQIVHHLADSQLNSHVRFKLALTEGRPTIKPYDESGWSLLADAQRADVEPSLHLLEGLHVRWAYLLRSPAPDAFERSFHHPETQEVVPLWRALAYYVWHARHHTAQIEWVEKHKVLKLSTPQVLDDPPQRVQERLDPTLLWRCSRSWPEVILSIVNDLHRAREFLVAACGSPPPGCSRLGP